MNKNTFFGAIVGIATILAAFIAYKQLQQDADVAKDQNSLQSTQIQQLEHQLYLQGEEVKLNGTMVHIQEIVLTGGPSAEAVEPLVTELQKTASFLATRETESRTTLFPDPERIVGSAASTRAVKPESDLAEEPEAQVNPPAPPTNTPQPPTEITAPPTHTLPPPTVTVQPPTVTPRPPTITQTLTPTSRPEYPPGDANEDCVVDEADEEIWEAHFGQSTENGSQDGDFNEDGFVDGFDYGIYWNHYGETCP